MQPRSRPSSSAYHQCYIAINSIVELPYTQQSQLTIHAMFIPAAAVKAELLNVQLHSHSIQYICYLYDTCTRVNCSLSAAAVRAELFNPRALFVFGTYTIGKERLFLEVARAVNKKVYVSKDKMQVRMCTAVLPGACVLPGLHVMPGLGVCVLPGHVCYDLHALCVQHGVMCFSL